MVATILKALAAVFASAAGLALDVESVLATEGGAETVLGNALAAAVAAGVPSGLPIAILNAVGILALRFTRALITVFAGGTIAIRLLCAVAILAFAILLLGTITLL